MIKTTEVFAWNLDAFYSKKRFIVNQGGTSSSKTYSVLQLLMFIAWQVPNLTISVISESLPHLKKGAIKDFISILRSANLYSEKDYNRTDQIFTIKTRGGGSSIIEFFSAEDVGKVTGPRRDILFLNECNHISKSVHDAAEVRTRRCIFYDFNPTNEFWLHDDVLTQDEKDLAVFTSTYLNNNQLEKSIIRSIESRRFRDPDWWTVFGLGKLGTLAGLIFPNWKVCSFDDLPSDPRKQGKGMDFGFTNDPTTLVQLMLKGDTLFLHEHLYQTNMHNNDIVKFFKQTTDMNDCNMSITKATEIVADSSNPKDISDLKRAGFTIIPADKPKGSVNSGIDLMKRYDLVVTKQSLNFIKELRNYKWKVNRDTGKPMNEPVDLWNHCIDPTRYDLDYLINGKRILPPMKMNWQE